jgi:hypothetical protein
MKHVIVVADWASDPLACQEFRSSVAGYSNQDKPPRIDFVPALASTIHVAYLTAQIAETEERYGSPLETVILAASDARLPHAPGDESARPGEFLFLRLASGMFVVGPNAGHTFSLIKPRILKAFVYPDIDSRAYGRTREVYSRMVAHLVQALEDQMQLDETHTASIPAMEGFVVGHIDAFGNIKTTMPREALKGKREYGETVTVRIGDTERHARFVEHLFAGNPGELVVYPGTGGPADDPYLEVSAWQRVSEDLGDTGAAHFGQPRPGMTLAIR